MSEQLNVTYRLSEVARKAEFLATGKMGSERRDLHFALTELTPEQRAILVEHRGLGHDSSYQPRYNIDIDAMYPAYEARWDQKFAQQGVHLSVTSTPHPLEAAPTLDEALHLLATYPERLVEARAAFQPEYEAEVAKCQAEADRKKFMEELDRRHRQERAEAEQRAKDAYETARTSWVEAHGSDHLKRAVAGGYDCTRLYLRERVALEYPGFVVDIEDASAWRSRSCPSLKALDLLDSIKSQHGAHITEGQIVWLTAPTHDTKAEPWDDGEEACEAVVLKDHRYKSYWLVREM